MAVIGVLRAMRGTVKFSAEGDRPERFINLCAMEGVPLWDGRRQGERYSACTTARGARSLAALAAKAGVRLQMEKERGPAALLRRYRRRLGLAAGGVLLACAVAAMGSFLWTVEINGLETIPEEEVRAALSEMGIRRGALRRSVDVRSCERRLLLKFDRLCWAGVNLHGSTATIELAERTLPPAMVGQEIPCNVTAARSGFITSMEVYNGQPVCKVGDSVEAGEVLVSGIMESGWGGSRYVHARARVTAQTAERLEVHVPFRQETLTPCGTAQRKYLEIFGARLPLTWARAPAEPNLREVSEKEIPALTRFTSARLWVEDYTLLEPAVETLTLDEACELARTWLEEEETLRFSGASILSRELTGQELPDGYRLSCAYVCEEVISQEVVIQTE